MYKETLNLAGLAGHACPIVGASRYYFGQGAEETKVLFDGYFLIFSGTSQHVPISEGTGGYTVLCWLKGNRFRTELYNVKI